MSSLRTWFRGSAPSSSKASREVSPAVSASPSTTAISADATAPSPAAAAAGREIADMEDAMASTALLLNDDMDGAEARLRARKDSSAFHLMGLSVSIFMRSVLGFEKEFMNEANTRLLECETRAWDEMKKAQAAATGTASSGGWLGRSSSTSVSTATPPAGVVTASIYPPGSEYALVHAESQIMLAVVAELHESLTEAIRGFYKLRKAFASLSGIIESEEAYLRGETSQHGHGHGHGHDGKASSRPSTGTDGRMSFTEDPMPGAFDDKEFADLEAELAAEEAAAAAKEEPLAPKPNGTASPKAANGTTATAAAPGTENKTPPPAPAQPVPSLSAPSLSEKTAALSLNGTGTSTGGTPRASSQASPGQTPTTASAAAPSSAARARKRHLDTLTNPIDVFVHSGANLCFGLLLVLISMVPPAFSRLLSIVGFKGDRERGVRMLWQSTKFSNVYGGLAGLMLLVYYNGLIANADILPAEADIAELTNNVGTDSSEMEVVGYPKDRCHALLAHMRALFPDSLLWVVEEARLLTTDRRIKEAMAVLQGSGSDGKPRVAKMRQITALTKFELAIDAMCTMEWALMRDTFLECVELNTWSHSLYYYNVGCAELELYRDAFHKVRALRESGDAEAADAAAAAAAKHKKAAEMYLRKAPTMAGRKKFMARQMPFDVFVIRKLARWEERAKKHGIDLADAVGVCPALEMAYLWGSAKKLPADLLELALNKYLVWERCTADATVVAAFQAAPDEAGIGSLCKAALLRALGRLEDAQAVLDKELFVHDRAVFKGPTKDDYVLAAGYYEAAVILWLQASDPKHFPAEAEAVDAYRHKKTNESLAMLDKVAKWETFVLDARIGMKLQTGLDAVKWLKAKKNWQ
ncbi:Mitochondrial outer membrane protein iml2 [Sporothrix curviconia]|uniref:Inclusion body clearance protein IML2 n=1 Tax=Sporothrix curviconia TaxID=1260050 RepID=A0ABP0CQW5_9PEZI